MKIHWLIDVDILGEHHQDVPRYLRLLGHQVTTLSATKNKPKLVNDPDNHVYVFHGSFEELRAVERLTRSLSDKPMISTYGLGKSILRSHYRSYLPKEWFLNSYDVMTTWGMLKNDPEIYDCNEKIFVRPDSGNKTFTGQVIDVNDFDHDILKIEQTSNVSPETIIWVSSAKTINAEYRFWISNGKVVASSEYSWTDKELGDIPASAYELAETVAKHDWQVDRIYVVDIHVCEAGEASIIEFNSFSCSGLYACDAKTLFTVVSEDVIKEWNDEE